MRGHYQDDMYYYDVTTSSLYYLTESGKNISLRHDSLIFAPNIVADPSPGRLFRGNGEQLFKSNDYGITFNQMLPVFSMDTSFAHIVGGEISGEYYIDAYNGISFMKLFTVDSFLNTSPCLNNFSTTDIGSMPGEIYSLGILSQGGYLCHSTDYGIHFDTIPIDSLLLNDIYLFYSLCRGSKEGELYLVTMIPAFEWQYKIYRSTDFGSTWVQFNMPQFQSVDTKFTAGRGDCTFYISNAYFYSIPTDMILDIYASSDCGATFTKYTHMLPPGVGINENQKTGHAKLNITPNPASEKTTLSYTLAIPAKISVNIYNSLGKCVLQTNPTMEQPGFSKTINIEGLPNGIYSVQLMEDGKIAASGKLVVSR